MDAHLATGRAGEEIACRHLEAQGYIIRERNWRYLHKEVDIIAQQGGDIVFVEVRTRSSGSWLRAMETVDRRKQQHLIDAASQYMRYHGLDYRVRYDIIAIDIASDGSYTLEHAVEAFYPRLRSAREGRPSHTRRR